MKTDPFSTRPNNWNGLQINILRRLANGEAGHFDRWRRLVIDGDEMTSLCSTTPYTLFIRGHIVSDGKAVTITKAGRNFLNSIFEDGDQS